LPPVNKGKETLLYGVRGKRRRQRSWQSQGKKKKDTALLVLTQQKKSSVQSFLDKGNRGKILISHLYSKAQKGEGGAQRRQRKKGGGGVESLKREEKVSSRRPRGWNPS